MAITSKVDICNMALSHLGNFGTVSNIDTPTNDKERIFALWFDITRQFVLKLLMPNFALTRLIVSKLVETPDFGFAFFYEYPATALKVLGIDEVRLKENNFNIERTPLGVKAISHDTDYTEGMPVRIIVDVTDINSWSPETKVLVSQYLAAYTALAITQDVAKSAKLISELPAQITSASGLNAQENTPIRISNSRFDASRFNDSPDFTSKK